MTTSKKYVQVSINLSPEQRDEINNMARRRGYKITSDYLRALIEADAKAHGENFNFDVDRGGYRGRSSDED